MWTKLMAKIRTVFSKPMALVGSLTALFAFIAGIYGGWNFLSTRLHERQALDGSMAAAKVQLDSSDYAAAWRTLEEASAVDPRSSRVAALREDVAMRWLENIHVSGNQRFSEVTDKVDPVLTRGITAATSPQRQADVMAHLGWSYFLARRESASGPDPVTLYRNALAKDPGNPYAEALWAHWILWNGGASAEADKHFATALETRPEVRPFVRRLQLSLRIDGHSAADDEEVIRIANDVRKEHGDLGSQLCRSILTVYYARLMPAQQSGRFLKAVPPAANLATFEWLAAQVGPNDFDGLSRGYLHSVLLEGAGRRDEALAGYRALEHQLGPGSDGPLPTATRKALIRLARPAVDEHAQSRSKVSYRTPA